jgi:hypothetical protein
VERLTRCSGSGSSDCCPWTLLLVILVLLWGRRLHLRVHCRRIAVRIVCRIMVAVVVLMLRLRLRLSNCRVPRLLIREIRAVLFFVLKKWHLSYFLYELVID